MRRWQVVTRDAAGKTINVDLAWTKGAAARGAARLNAEARGSALAEYGARYGLGPPWTATVERASVS